MYVIYIYIHIYQPGPSKRGVPFMDGRELGCLSLSNPLGFFQVKKRPSTARNTVIFRHPGRCQGGSCFNGLHNQRKGGTLGVMGNGWDLKPPWFGEDGFLRSSILI